MGTEGYIAVVNEFNATNHNSDQTEGSPIFRLKDDKVVPIQYFVRSHQRRVQFIKLHSELLMWQSFETVGKTTNETAHNCPLMKLFDTTFSEIENIPCTNAMQIDAFVIDGRLHVTIANYMDEHHNIETHSTIYQYDIKQQKFIFVQKIKTFGAIDIKYVHIDDNHFVIVANSFRPFGSVHSRTISSNAVVYLFDHDHAKFVPVQILTFDDEVTQLLPYMVGILVQSFVFARMIYFATFCLQKLQGENKEFALLVSMAAGTTKLYEYDGFQFFQTPITFTGGSLGRGVSKMRTFNMNDNFLVLGNLLCDSSIAMHINVEFFFFPSISCRQCRYVSRCNEFVSLSIQTSFRL